MEKKDLGQIFRAFFGADLDIYQYSHRIGLQKLIYLLQNRKGSPLNLDYYFSWYVRGPYSPRLTDEAYKIPKIEENTPKKFYEETSKVHQLLGTNNADAIDKKVERLELYASVLYLLKHGWSKDETFEQIRKTKPWFKEEDVRHVVKRFFG